MQIDRAAWLGLVVIGNERLLSGVVDRQCFNRSVEREFLVLAGKLDLLSVGAADLVLELFPRVNLHLAAGQRDLKDVAFADRVSALLILQHAGGRSQRVSSARMEAQEAL
ncbi:hypothetical protein D3C87_1571640 [compost metagenome]